MASYQSIVLVGTVDEEMWDNQVSNSPHEFKFIQHLANVIAVCPWCWPDLDHWGEAR